MRSAADFERVIAEHAQSMAAQQITYAEISFNPSFHDGADWLAGVAAGRDRAREEFGVEIAWLVELVRDGNVESNERALEIAFATAGVVGIGLVGDESASSAPVAPLVDRAHAKGLRFMPHAGQVRGADVVRDALENLHADRIAHGVSAVGEPALLQLLTERRVCLCICPTSNARIGLRPNYRKLADAGVPLTVNSDDPAMVGTTLTQELERAESILAIDRQQLLANAEQFAFRT
jgi:aminodeoxyfutalosine deaminase